MQKDFDGWNSKKKYLHEKVERLFFHEGEIWWAHIGVNVGYETDGKRNDFSRPVLILKKYNRFSFLALPLSSVEKENRYWISIGVVDGRNAYGILSQLRNIDSKRLINKVGYVSKEKLSEIKKKASEVNLI